MKDDLKHLKELLIRKTWNTVLSQEVGVGILAIAGTTVIPWTIPSGLLGVGALIKAAKGYNSGRKEALSKHAMSWLFTLSQRGPLHWF